jgi:Gas vesicle synthesis protein GvpL/GvpF
MNPKPSSNTSTYVYCVGYAESLADSDMLASLNAASQHGALRIVQYEDLAAIVSDSRELRPRISRENLAAHQRVIEEAMTRSDVLPVSFGTLASSDDEVQEKLLKRELDELHSSFERIRGCVELGLKVFWNREQVFAEIVQENADIRALRDSLAPLPPDTRTYDRIQLGQLTEAALNRKREQESERMLSSLEPLAVEAQLNSILTETMILNAAFLVEKDRVPAFDSAVQALNEGQADRLIFRYVGPLPPYNFVNLSVTWED